MDWIDGRKSVDFFNHTFEKISFFQRSLFNNLTECNSIQAINFSWCFANNRCSSWCVIHQWKLSKSLSLTISFQVFFWSINQFEAVILSTFYDEKLITTISLTNNCITLLKQFFWHGFNQSLLIFRINILEKNWVSDEWFDE